MKDAEEYVSSENDMSTEEVSPDEVRVEIPFRQD